MRSKRDWASVVDVLVVESRSWPSLKLRAVLKLLRAPWNFCVTISSLGDSLFLPMLFPLMPMLGTAIPFQLKQLVTSPRSSS
jgi:hypothetical protein